MHPIPANTRALRLPRAFYAAYYAGIASLVPYLTLHYRSLSLSGRQIGVLSALMPLAILISAPLWTGIADAKRRHKRILIIAITGMMLAVMALWQMKQFWGLLIAVVALAVFQAPIISLVDNTVLEMLGDSREMYGKQRLAGAIGFSIAAPLIGLGAERVGLGIAFVGFLVLMGFGLILASALPVRGGVAPVAYLIGLRRLVTNRRWAVLMVAVFLVGAGRMCGLQFLAIHLDDMGGTKSLLGFVVMVAALSELPTLYFSDVLLRQLGPRRLLLIAAAASFVMLLAFALMRAPWLALLIQLLHGSSFSLLWVAAVAISDGAAPEGMGATAQGLLGAMTSGLAASAGALVGGAVYDRWGGSGSFYFGAALVGAAIVVYALTARDPQPER